MYILYTILSLACCAALTSADTGVCKSLWVAASDNEGAPEPYYTSDLNTYTLAIPYQTWIPTNPDATMPAPPPINPTLPVTNPPLPEPSLSASQIIPPNIDPSAPIPPPPMPTVPITPTQNGYCGASHNDTTCLGWPLGECCSQYGACGSTNSYCMHPGCQTMFGNCIAYNIQPGGGAYPSSADVIVDAPSATMGAQIPISSSNP